MATGDPSGPQCMCGRTFVGGGGCPLHGTPQGTMEHFETGGWQITRKELAGLLDEVKKEVAIFGRTVLMGSPEEQIAQCKLVEAKTDEILNRICGPEKKG